MKIAFGLANETFIALPEANASAMELAAMLPLDLETRDFAQTEKIAICRES